jgi:hypothetical protein
VLNPHLKFQLLFSVPVEAPVKERTVNKWVSIK